ncbi:Flp pilus assembly protein TadG [Kitasatospora sp. MAA4]|uniref:TadE/TadG family type IV pilus assembly protein n=1 Tax=Kitasatospora sp. MAA4 TaxID=3035093 RepID=UPI0024749109|nr:pilus assembly protein [Kitasatospora sp. MAA4]MDH6133609.1 Flp pilus assembly protein TadG [Kitasatospora sp. MAA4]
MIRERRRERDSGVLSISLALVFPAVLFLVVLVAQSSLLWYTDSVALTAAREGVDAGRAYGSSDQDATSRAQAFLDRFGGLLGKPTVDTPVRTATDMTVTVRVDPLILLPGFDGLKITQSASAPIERYVTP